MNAENSNESKVKLCGIVVLLGAALSVIPFFTVITYAFRGESPYSFTLLLRSLATLAGFSIIGYGIFKDKRELFKIGLFIATASFVLDAYFPFLWTKENYKYFGSLTKSLGGENFVLLLCYLSAVVGFVLMGIHFSQKSEEQSANLGTIAMVFIAAYIVLLIGHAIYYMKENYISFWPYVSAYFTGASVLSIVGAAGVLLMPYAFPVETSQQRIINESGTENKAESVEQIGAEGQVSQKMDEADAFALLRKYKQLLDAEVITQEEFDSKKKELL